MTEIIQSDVELAFAAIEYFREHGLDAEADFIIEASEILSCASILIQWYGLDYDIYWPSKIANMDKKGKGVSIVRLLDAIEPLYLQVEKLDVSRKEIVPAPCTHDDVF